MNSTVGYEARFHEIFGKVLLLIAKHQPS